MTIYKTAYDTSACSGFPVKDTHDKLEKGKIGAGLRSVSIRTQHEPDGFVLQLLEGGNSSADAIPYFMHPMLMKSSLKGHDDVKPEFALDVRPFGKWYAPNETFIVRNQPEFEWNVKRAILNQVWISERPEILRDLSPIPMATYATLIAECVAKRFALDPAERIKVMVLAAFFYNCLFIDERELDEMERNKIVGVISRVINVPAEKVFEYVGEMPLLHSLVDLCEAAKKLTQSIALQDLNIGTLVAITSGTWYGTNARENLAVGLEHVPTWLMCVHASLTEATFKRSQLNKISSQFDRRGAADNFTKSLNVLLGGQDVVGRTFAMEGFGDLVKAALTNAKLALTTDDKKRHQLKEDKQGRVEFNKKYGDQVQQLVHNALRMTYDNPDWVKKNVAEKSEAVTHGLMGYLYAGGKPVPAKAVAHECEKIMHFVDELRRKEDPFHLTRWTVYTEVEKIAKTAPREEWATQVGELYEKHSKSLSSPISDRIDPAKANAPAIGCKGSMLTKYEGDANYVYNTYYPGHFKAGEAKPVYAGVSQDNYQEYVQALKDLVKLSFKFDTMAALSANRIHLPYFEDLPKIFWEPEVESTKYFELYVENVTCTQGREEIGDFYYEAKSSIMNAITALYYLLFNA